MDLKQDNEQLKLGFFKTFISVCSGTSIFPNLVNTSLFKMLFHLIIVVILGIFLNVSFRLHPFNVAYEKITSSIQQSFGNINFSKKGITPSIKPELSHSFSQGNLRVDYLPKFDDLKSYKPASRFLYGIAWTPESLVSWVQYNNKLIPLIPLLIPLNVNTDLKELITSFKKNQQSSGTVEDLSKLCRITPGTLNNKTTPIKDFKTNIFGGIPLSIPSLYLIFIITESLINSLLIAPFYLLILTIFSMMLGHSATLSLNFKQLFVINVYTAFPGFIIASLYTALQLPYFDFQNVFLLAYIIYSFPVFNRLRRELKVK